MGTRLIIALLGLVFSAELVAADGAPAAAPHSGLASAQLPNTFVDRWSAQLAAQRGVVDAVYSAADALHSSALGAEEYAALPRDEHAVDEAVQLAVSQHHAEAIAVLERVLEIPQPPLLAQRAHDAAAFAADELRDSARVIEHADLARRALATIDSDPNADPAFTVAAHLRAPHRELVAARAALAAGQFSEALRAARAAADARPTSLIVHEAATLAARAQLGLPAERAAGVAAMDRLLSRYPEYPLYDRAIVELAAAEIALGRDAAAVHRLDSFLWDRPFSGHAAEANTLLDSAIARSGAPRAVRSVEAQRQRGEALRRARFWDLSRETLEAALSASLLHGDAVVDVNAIRFELAMTCYDMADFTGSLRWLDEIEAAGGGGITDYNRSIWRGRNLSRLGQREAALATYRAYYDRHGGSERSERYYEDAMDLGLWSDAMTVLRARLRTDREWESWDGAFTTYLAGDPARAATLFSAMARRASGETKARYQYWQARASADAGRVDDALRLYESIASAQGYRYYGLQAANRLAEWREVLDAPPAGDGSGAADVAPAGPARPQPAPGRMHWGGRGAAAAGGLAALELQDPESFFASYPASVRRRGATSELGAQWGEVFPAARVAAALIDVGARELARQELRDVVVEFRGLDAAFAAGRRPTGARPIRLGGLLWAHTIDNRSRERGWWGITLSEPRFPYPSSSSARRTEVDRQSAIRDGREALREQLRAALRELDDIFMVRRFAMDRGLGTLDTAAASTEWRDAYPHAYADRIRGFLEQTDINPFLLWGLMIVESDMNPDTISPADAYGLLQVIPKTGDRVASDLGEADFGIHQLIEPSESLRFGTWYLRELLEKFHGQEMLAMVAYNAGPHQVQRWLEWRGAGMDLDAFIETVPYDGARRYPQRILRYTALLRGIDGGPMSLYIGNSLDPSVEDNIYY
ncbi:MAG: lytic transglycosylase domain-containing protein [Myxococcales bacterium]|nr:lytic transglycosylase domain-containing protein [Myxococcales bacterium]